MCDINLNRRARRNAWHRRNDFRDPPPTAIAAWPVSGTRRLGAGKRVTHLAREIITRQRQRQYEEPRGRNRRIIAISGCDNAVALAHA